MLAAVGVALAAPNTASAHSRAPTIALDVHLRVDSIPGIRAKVIDGNRRLRLTVDPRVTLIVRGLLDEPVLRFGGAGVWVNPASPTAAADQISSRHGSGWVRLTTKPTSPGTITDSRHPADDLPGRRPPWIRPEQLCYARGPRTYGPN